jgi:hypothetical protein
MHQVLRGIEMKRRTPPGKLSLSLLGAYLLVSAAAGGCWKSAGDGGANGPGGADADAGTDEETESLSGVACGDLSPCVYSETSGYTCPGFATDVQCWNLGAACDAAFLCASASQACEIACAASTCIASASAPPTPVCQ